VHEAGGRVQLLVRAVEAEALEEMTRGPVLRVVSGEERHGPAILKGVRDHGPARFERESLPPVRPSNVNAELVDATRDVVRAEPAASRELA
jgi:hypothetical protein